MNKVTFGAKLITPPEKFYLNTDTPVERIHINNMFKEIDGFLNMPEVDKFTSGDSVELIRKPSKNLFKYEIHYKSKTKLADAINNGIKMNCEKKKAFGSFNTIFQIIIEIIVFFHYFHSFFFISFYHIINELIKIIIFLFFVMFLYLKFQRVF